MNRLFLVFAVFCVFVSATSAQKLSGPLLLGTWTDGGDPSEFLLHRVMERSAGLLEDNPQGKLIVRVCTDGDFKTAFIKTPLNPLSAGNYNVYFRLFPYERIFIANWAKCSGDDKSVFNEYWFIPNKEKLDYDEIHLHQSIFFARFEVNENRGEESQNKFLKEKNAEFLENINAFIKILKNNPEFFGFIVHNSNNKRMKNNIAKVKAILTAEKIDNSRVRIVNRIHWDSDRTGEVKPIRDEGLFFPNLEILTLAR